MSREIKAEWAEVADGLRTVRFLDGVSRELVRMRMEMAAEAARVGKADASVAEALRGAAADIKEVAADVARAVGEVQAWMADREMGFMSSERVADSLIGPMSAEDKDAEAGPKEGPPATVQPLRGRRDYGASVRARKARGSLLESFIPQHGVADLRRKVDEQTYELAVEVWSELNRVLTLDPAQQEAFNRLQSSVGTAGWREDMHRNNIFKAAHALGMKLPSSMF